MTLYTTQLRDALTGAIDTQKLAEAWQALHPPDVTKGSGPGRESNPRVREDATPRPPLPAPAWLPGRLQSDNVAMKAVSPILSAFLHRASQAIKDALRAVFARLYAEGWVLGQQSARALTGPGEVDWAGWTPGDVEAAEKIAGAGLRQLLENDGVQIKSIADTRVEELADVLEQTLLSDVTKRPPLPEPLPPQLSAGDLARQLKDVLDNSSRAELVAQAEIGRAQAEAARTVYAEEGVAEVEISTAGDDKVCPICQAAEEVGAHPVGVPPMVLLHPRCRCAELPVLAGTS